MSCLNTGSVLSPSFQCITDGDEMYEKGNMVMYGPEGACRITDIVEKSFHDKSGVKKYYVLESVSNPDAKIYVPCDSEILVSRMKRILSYAQIKDILSSDRSYCEWIDDSKIRNRAFKDILSSYDREKIIGLAKLLCRVKAGKTEIPKKLCTSDEELLKKLKKILYSEFSLTVDITEDEIEPFILGDIEGNEK
ncbi:MAG: CarD family transcriptional regulator [Eubacteriales bacterium]